MSSGRWADESSDHQMGDTAPETTTLSESGPPLRRKKLTLKPRGSSTQSTTTASASSSSSTTAKSSIFGAAKPREEVLASKGIDAKLVDERITKKATIVHYTKEQNDEIQAIQAELTKAENDLRDANEKELPEESFRVLVDAKRAELHDLMETYATENAAKQTTTTTTTTSSTTGERKHFERPSERRKRLEEQHHNASENRYDHHEDEPKDAFQHFGGRNRHHHGDHEDSRSGSGRYNH